MADTTAGASGLARWGPHPSRRPGPAASCPACGTAVPGSTLPGAALPPPITAALLRASTLSPREKLAFQLLGQGCDNRTIARELTISERTAKRHVTAILTKLKLESRLQAGIAALVISYPPEPAAACPEGR